MTTPNPDPGPQPDPALALSLERYAASQRPSAATSADLDRYDIAVVLQAVYEWGGYRYSNASDAIAAAKRRAK